MDGAGAITYGTALSGDAVERDGRSVPGTFVVHAGERDGARAPGTQTLSVTFTPTNTADYNDATATVAITVSQGDAGDHLADAGGDHLRHGAQCDAAERDGPAWLGTFVYTPPSGHGARAPASGTRCR